MAGSPRGKAGHGVLDRNPWGIIMGPGFPVVSVQTWGLWLLTLGCLLWEL
jgi:hypothetical protein